MSIITNYLCRVSAKQIYSLKCANGCTIFEINYPRHASKFAIKIVLSTLQTGMMG